MRSKIDQEMYEQEGRAKETLTWNESVKLAATLLHWELGKDYLDLLQLMQAYHEWEGHSLFEQSEQLLQQLLDKWPVEDMAPRIWACFHVGPYELIARALVKKGFGVAILLNEEIYDDVYSVYMEGFRRNFDRDPFLTDLQFIRVGNAGSLLQLKRCLAEGMHVVCFADGEKAGTSSRDKTTVRLYRMEMYARLDIARLAHWTNVPVRPLALTVTDDVLNVTSPEDYFVRSKVDYPALLQSCFNTMTTLTSRELVQWELLPSLFDRLYPHLDDDNITEDTTWLKTALWMPILLPDKHLFIDLRTGRGVEIPEAEHQIVYGGFRKMMAGFSGKNSFVTVEQ